MNEFEIIKRYFQRKIDDPDLKLGIGDDCAIFNFGSNNVAVTTDTLVEGVHFFPDVEPHALGYKSLAVNISDLAAMGAVPRYFTLALTIPEYNQQFLEQFTHGLFEIANRHQIRLIGGDTTRGPLSITITAIGEISHGKEITRHKAKIGDDIYVSGDLGGAALAVFLKSNQTHLNDQYLEIEAFKRLEYPIPRVNLGLKLVGIASSMLDLSDGLSSDLEHIVRLSNVGAIIDLDLIPYSQSLYEIDMLNRINMAISGGDDYELCFTSDPENREAISKLSTELNIPVTIIGSITDNIGNICYHMKGMPFELHTKGYNHFTD